MDNFKAILAGLYTPPVDKIPNILVKSIIDIIDMDLKRRKIMSDLTKYRDDIQDMKLFFQHPHMEQLNTVSDVPFQFRDYVHEIVTDGYSDDVRAFCDDRLETIFYVFSFFK